MDSCQRKGGGGNGGKKGKEVVKEHAWTTHGHGQRGGDGLWEQGVDGKEEGKSEKLGQL